MRAKSLFLAILLTATPALADAPRCFLMSQMDGWRSPDGKSIYIRAVGHIYKLELARECSALKSVGSQLLLNSHLGGQVCSQLDLDVKASDMPGGVVEPCFPKMLSELTPAEAAALPKNARP